MAVFRHPSFIPYQRKKRLNTFSTGQIGGTATATLVLTASGSGTKAAEGSGTALLALSASATGTKSAGDTNTATLVLTGSGDGYKAATGTGTATLVLTAEGRTPPELPFHDRYQPTIYTALRKPPFRFIAQHARTGQYLSLELPVLDPTVKLSLSGPTVITGKLKPETISLKDDYGTPLLKSWGSLIHYEMDGQIRASGILMPSEFEGPEWTLEARGFSTYPNEMPYYGDWPSNLRFNIDSIDVIQEIWRYLQSFPNGNLGVQVPRNVGPLPVRLGAELDASNIVKPYSLDWWDAKNCGSEIDNMAKLAPLDYKETVQWKTDRSGVVYILTLAYPRLGTTRTDLRFVQGENIIQVVPLVEPDDFYASGVIGIGAGEGAYSIRDMVETNDPNRLRRIYTYRQKKMTDKTQLNSVIRDELASRSLDREIQQIVISSTHPNAPFGSYSVGDDILPQAEVRWWGWTRIWHRITGITFNPGKDSVVLDLKRSSSFRYGTDVGE